jgi:hypothetical protein
LVCPESGPTPVLPSLGPETSAPELDLTVPNVDRELEEAIKALNASSEQILTRDVLSEEHPAPAETEGFTNYSPY